MNRATNHEDGGSATLALSRKNRESVVAGCSNGVGRLFKGTVLEIRDGIVRLGVEAGDDSPCPSLGSLGTDSRRWQAGSRLIGKENTDG